MNNYVPINDKLSYNPNVQIDNFQNNQPSQPNQSNGNMNNMNNMNMNNMNMNNMNNMNSMNNMNNMMYQNNMPMNSFQVPNMVNNRKNNVINTIENMDNNEEGFLSKQGKKIKQLLIYTILFIIFSHTKMTEILCNNISFLSLSYSSSVTNGSLLS